MDLQSDNHIKESSIFLAGTRITISGLIAICEAFAKENYELFSFLVSIAGEANSSQISEIVPLLRELIRSYSPGMLAGVGGQVNDGLKSSGTPNSPNHEFPLKSDSPSSSNISVINFYHPPPPPFPQTKTPSQLEYEEACRIAEEEDRRIRQENEERDHLEALKVAKEMDEEYKARTTFHCQICLDQHPVHGSYSLECGHRFCEECISGHICSKINSHEVNDDTMVCPIPGCLTTIPHTIIRGCTKDLNNSEAYEKYCEFQKDTFIATEIQNGCMFRCPTELCNNVFYYSLNNSYPLPFTCDACNHAYCINCRVVNHPSFSSTPGVINSPTAIVTTNKGHFGPGHYPFSCQQQVEKLLHDVIERKKFEEWKVLNANAQRLFEEAIQSKGWKRCPSCSVYIERNEGCDHMTCRVCKCNFCYVCGKYDQANPTNRGDCGSSCSRS